MRGRCLRAPTGPGSQRASRLLQHRSRSSFLLNRETAVSYLNSLHHVFVFDGYANWDPDSRIKVRTEQPAGQPRIHATCARFAVPLPAARARRLLRAPAVRLLPAPCAPG